jgi:chorismate mutase
MTLEEWRKIVDQLNGEIIALFSKRLEITREIARIKKEHNLPVHDPIREQEQLELLHDMARKHGLCPSVIEEIFHVFVEYSKCNMQLEMSGEKKNRLSGS